MMEKTVPYGFGMRVQWSFEETVARAKEALKEKGFGILCEIDVQEKIREKVGADFRPYVILGACNPKLAHQALSVEIDLGLLLPCNVIVYEEEQGCTVMAMDPEKALGVVDNPAMAPIASQVGALLREALESL